MDISHSFLAGLSVIVRIKGMIAPDTVFAGYPAIQKPDIMCPYRRAHKLRATQSSTSTFAL
jgi:hypothetical protein